MRKLLTATLTALTVLAGTGAANAQELTGINGLGWLPRWFHPHNRPTQPHKINSLKDKGDLASVSASVSINRSTSGQGNLVLYDYYTKHCACHGGSWHGDWTGDLFTRAWYKCRAAGFDGGIFRDHYYNGGSWCYCVVMQCFKYK